MTREEAIRRIKAWNLDSDDMEVLIEVVPELAESEDERIIRLLRELGSLDAAKELYEEFNLSYTDVLYWLEKQKEQKDYRKLYEDIARSEWFEKAYVGKSLGEEDEKEDQKPADYNEYKMLIDGAREDGKIKGRKEVIDHPEEYGLTKQKPSDIAPNQFNGITYGMQGHSTEKPNLCDTGRLDGAKLVANNLLRYSIKEIDAKISELQNLIERYESIRNKGNV